MTNPRSGFKDHFSGAPARYAAYRPSYPPALIEYLARISPALERAWDCGCGSGQLATRLAERFKEVIATDASAAQIASAMPHARVSYRVAAAEDSGLPAGAVSLVAAAQAAHWFELTRFYAEVRRVARPRAALALISYGVLEVQGAPDAAVQRFYRHIIGPYWPPERRHIESGYRDLPFPFEELRPPPLAIEVDWSLEELLGYIDTWSAMHAAQQSLGRAPIDAFERELAEAWGDAAQRRVRWPLSLRVGRV